MPNIDYFTIEASEKILKQLYTLVPQSSDNFLKLKENELYFSVYWFHNASVINYVEHFSKIYPDEMVVVIFEPEVYYRCRAEYYTVHNGKFHLTDVKWNDVYGDDFKQYVAHDDSDDEPVLLAIIGNKG